MRGNRGGHYGQDMGYYDGKIKNVPYEIQII